MIDKWDKRYEKIACELLEQFASKNLNVEESRYVLELISSAITRISNDSPLMCENNPR